MDKTRVCVICGRPCPTNHRTTCGRWRCKLLNQWEYQHRWLWAKSHPGEPIPPRRERLTHCRVCGKPLANEWGTPVTACSDFCRKVLNADAARRYYQERREEVLAQQAGYRAKLKETEG